MTGTTDTASTRREPDLLGQTVVLIGGSSGIGFQTARRARADGAEVILTGRDPDRLKQAADVVGARQTAAFDATDAAALKQFFQDLPGPINHVMVTAGGPHYGPLLAWSLPAPPRPGSLGCGSNGVTTAVIHSCSGSVPSTFSLSSASSSAHQMPTLRRSPTGRHSRYRWPLAASSRDRTASAARRLSTSSWLVPSGMAVVISTRNSRIVVLRSSAGPR
nr:SDR family NAD(P)-dependent oxidoreductase [Catenulispora pinisilvae]